MNTDDQTGYPLLLDLSGRRAVVVGGGPVAARRARALVYARAQVRVVAPYLCEDLAELAASAAVDWTAREYEPGDLGDAWLVHTATGDREVDAAVSAEAQGARIWCVRADDALASTAWTPAVARVDDIVVAVSSGGDPRRARRIRDGVAAQIETGALPLRRYRAPASGSVALVGGGPGDAGLLTSRGRRLLLQADVVIVDRLAPRAVLDELDPDVLVIDVGKAPGNHAVPQEDIHTLLVEHAAAGRRVVRLKGGDPYVLGRGAEEVAACRTAGIPVEVVSGVTSAFAVPAAAGIPVTSRGLARQVTVASGHDALDWAALAALEGTLVLLMAVSRLGDSAAALICAGKDAATPAAVVEDGFGPRQRVTTATLGAIAERARSRGVRPPAVVVVGEVAALARETG